MNNKAILSIEDNDIVNYYNEDLVTELEEEYNFINFDNVQDGIEFVKRGIEDNSVPGLWLIDINLPDGNGFSFIDEAVKLFEGKTLPKIYLLTTSIHRSDKEEFNKRTFINGYLEKPLTVLHLQDCILN